MGHTYHHTRRRHRGGSATPRRTPSRLRSATSASSNSNSSRSSGNTGVSSVARAADRVLTLVTPSRAKVAVKPPPETAVAAAEKVPTTDAQIAATGLLSVLTRGRERLQGSALDHTLVLALLDVLCRGVGVDDVSDTLLRELGSRYGVRGVGGKPPTCTALAAKIKRSYMAYERLTWYLPLPHVHGAVQSDVYDAGLTAALSAVREALALPFAAAAWSQVGRAKPLGVLAAGSAAAASPAAYLGAAKTVRALGKRLLTLPPDAPLAPAVMAAVVAAEDAMTAAHDQLEQATESERVRQEGRREGYLLDKWEWALGLPVRALFVALRSSSRIDPTGLADAVARRVYSIALGAIDDLGVARAEAVLVAVGEAVATLGKWRAALKAAERLEAREALEEQRLQVLKHEGAVPTSGVAVGGWRRLRASRTRRR